MSTVGISEKPAHLEPDSFIADRTSTASRYGATWVQENWGTTPFSPFDTFRTLGYRFTKRMVSNGLVRRMAADVFT